MSTTIAAHPRLSAEARAYNTWAVGSSRLEQLLRLEDDCLLVAEVDGRIEGAVLFSRDTGGVLYLCWICVHPQARSKRIGPLLLKTGLEDAIARGYRSVWGMVLAENRSVHRYLARLGCKRVGLLENHWFGQDYVLWQYLPRNPADSISPIAPNSSIPPP